MLGFIIGLFVGGTLGVLIMACLNAASRADDRIEKFNKDNDEDNMDV